MFVAIFEWRHVAVADEEAIEDSVDEYKVDKLMGEGEDEHGEADA